MNKFSHRIFITLVTLCMVSGLDQANESKYQLKNNKKLRETFNKLLHSVTSVNEERLDALKKFYELQNYLPKVGRSDDKVVAFIIPNSNQFDPKRYDDEFYKIGPNIEPSGTSEFEIFKGTKDKADGRNLKIDSGDKSFFLRKWRGCNKSAAKSCKRACNTAFKDVCSDYKCSKSMKRAGKKSCKAICRTEFGYDDDE